MFDNLVPEVEPATERRDLAPVYSFNGTGLWLAKQRGAGKLVGGTKRLNLWAQCHGHSANDRHGYQAGDELLRRTAAILKASAAGQTLLAARLGGADFALLGSGITVKEADGLARGMLNALGQLSAAGLPDAEDVAHVGVARSGERVTDSIARADLALCRAQEKGPNEHRLFADLDLPATAPPGAAQWKERLLRHLAEATVLLHLQPWSVRPNPVTSSRIEHRRLPGLSHRPPGGTALLTPRPRGRGAGGPRSSFRPAALVWSPRLQPWSCPSKAEALDSVREVAGTMIKPSSGLDHHRPLRGNRKIDTK